MRRWNEAKRSLVGGRAELNLAERRVALRRWVARISWCLARMDGLDAAQKAADAAWARLIATDPDSDSAPPEQAEVDRLLAEVERLIDHGEWPRHLHWSL